MSPGHNRPTSSNCTLVFRPREVWFLHASASSHALLPLHILLLLLDLACCPFKLVAPNCALLWGPSTCCIFFWECFSSISVYRLLLCHCFQLLCPLCWEERSFFMPPYFDVHHNMCYSLVLSCLLVCLLIYCSSPLPKREETLWEERSPSCSSLFPTTKHIEGNQYIFLNE